MCTAEILCWNLCPHPTLPSLFTCYDDSFLCLPPPLLSLPWLHWQCHCCCVSVLGRPLLVTRWPEPSPARCPSAPGLLRPPERQERRDNMEFQRNYPQAIVLSVRTSSSSSSLSSLMVRLGGTGVAKGEDIIGTLNFSAAALWACWDKSSIWGEDRRSDHKVKEGQIQGERKSNLCLSKYDVNVRDGAFEHIGSADDKQDAFGLPNCDSGDAVDWLQTQFGHGLKPERDESVHKITFQVQFFKFLERMSKNCFPFYIHFEQDDNYWYYSSDLAGLFLTSALFRSVQAVVCRRDGLRQHKKKKKTS